MFVIELVLVTLCVPYGLSSTVTAPDSILNMSCKTPFGASTLVSSGKVVPSVISGDRCWITAFQVT